MKRLDEHSQWDKEWAKAFEDTGQAPPPNVWNNIQAVQANKEADKFRKRAFVYKWLAAASVFISICSAALLLVNSDKLYKNDGVAVNKPVEQQPVIIMPDNGSVTDKQEESVAAHSTADGKGEDEKDVRRKYSKKGTQTGNLQESSNSLAVSTHSKKVVDEEAKNVGEEVSVISASETTVNGSDSESSNTTSQLAMEEKAEAGELGDEGNETANDLPLVMHERNSLASIDKRGLVTLRNIEEDQTIEAEIRKVWVASNFLKKDKSGSDARFMLGASIASNNFSANYLDKSPEMASLAQNADNIKIAKPSPLTNARVTDWDEEQESEMSITGGLQAAAWIGKRWLLQGGLQYGNYKTTSTASTYTDPSGFNSYPLHFANYSEEKVAEATFSRRSRSASTVSATNAFEFLSVPISVGYVVVDGRLSFLVSPGISSEFFLSNTISADEGSDLSAFTVSNGEESPFSFVHFRGLISAQLFYKMSDNYIISLEPGYQHAITDFNKSDSFFSSRPSNISIAAGFRYVFR